MRRHNDPTKCPKRKTAQAEDNSSPEDPTTPTVATTPTTATSTGALHPIRGTAPVTWRCTRYVAVHPNRRGALPTDRVQCPNKQEQTRNWHTEPPTAAPLHAQLGPTVGRMGTPPTPPPALRPTPTPPTPLNAKSRITSTCYNPYIAHMRAGKRLTRPKACKCANPRLWGIICGGVWVFRTVCLERVVLSSPGRVWPGRMDDHEEVLEAHA